MNTWLFAFVIWFVLGTGVAVAGPTPLASGLSAPIPAGWRLPTAVDLGTGRPTRPSFPSGIVVSGDFNGDGRKDEAALLVTTDGSRYGLFVFLAEGPGFRVERLFERGARGIRGVRISRVSPGRYATMCGQGYYACAPGEAKYITLKCDAIDEIYEEGADIYYYWDSKTKSFEALQMSD
jgi:hypothetical protein